MINYTDEQLRKIDILVAERVMEWDGCHRIQYCEDNFYQFCKLCGNTGADFGEIFYFEVGHDDPISGCTSSPKYTTDISHAWMVVEKITEPSYPIDLDCLDIPPNVKFTLWFDKFGLWAMTAEQAAREISIAALDAVGVNIDKELE